MCQQDGLAWAELFTYPCRLSMFLAWTPAGGSGLLEDPGAQLAVSSVSLIGTDVDVSARICAEASE